MPLWAVRCLEVGSSDIRQSPRDVAVRSGVVVIEPGYQEQIWDKVEAMDLGPYRGTPYERVLERFRTEALRGGRRAPPATIVARAAWRALSDRRPPTRIVVSAHSFLEAMMVRMPDRILDWVIRRMVWKKGEGGRGKREE